METRTQFEILPEDSDGAVLITHQDMFGKVTEMWLDRKTANELAQAIIADRMK